MDSRADHVIDQPLRPFPLLLPGLLRDAGVWASRRAALGGEADIAVPDFSACESIEAMADVVQRQVLHGNKSRRRLMRAFCGRTNGLSVMAG